MRGILEEARTSYRDVREQNEHQEGIRNKLESYSEADFSPYDDSFEITKVLKEMMDVFSKEGQADKAIGIIRDGILTPARECIDETRSMPDARSCSETVLTREKDKQDSLRDEVQHNIGQVQQFVRENSEHPEFSPLVTWSILSAIFLFYAGVVYPLSFLPLDKALPFCLSISAFFDVLSSLKGVLLAMISIIFTIIMIVFIRINHSLRLRQEDLDELKTYTKHSTYSEYLANFFANADQESS